MFAPLVAKVEVQRVGRLFDWKKECMLGAQGCKRRTENACLAVKSGLIAYDCMFTNKGCIFYEARSGQICTLACAYYRILLVDCYFQ